MSGVLDGLRVLELSTVVMGPYATQLLGDLGADIIKVEAPAGDTTRQIAPMRHPMMGNAFIHLNRNKRSIVLDMKGEGGIETFFKLAEGADAFLTNVRPQALARLGVTWEALSKVNPGLVFVSLVGFGATGRYAGRPVYEDLIQGLTAVPSMLVHVGAPQPQYVPVTFNDNAVGQAAAINLLAAVRYRDKTGRGQKVEVPMFEVMAQATLHAHLGGRTFEPALGPAGYQRVLTSERRPFATLDGYVCVIIYTDRHWRNFFDLVGEPERMNEPRMKNLGTRTEHSKSLYALVAEHIATKTTDVWLSLLEDADIPATPLHTLDSLIDDPHLNESGFLQVSDHPTEGSIRQMGVPATYSEIEHGIAQAAPRLGEHTVEILSEAGLSKADIDRLLEDGVVVQADK